MHSLGNGYCCYLYSASAHFTEYIRHTRICNQHDITGENFPIRRGDALRLAFNLFTDHTGMIARAVGMTARTAGMIARAAGMIARAAGMMAPLPG